MLVATQQLRVEQFCAALQFFSCGFQLQQAIRLLAQGPQLSSVSAMAQAMVPRSSGMGCTQWHQTSGSTLEKETVKRNHQASKPRGQHAQRTGKKHQNPNAPWATARACQSVVHQQGSDDDRQPEHGPTCQIDQRILLAELCGALPHGECRPSNSERGKSAHHGPHRAGSGNGNLSCETLGCASHLLPAR